MGNNDQDCGGECHADCDPHPACEPKKYEPYVCDPEKAIATFGDVDFIGVGGQLLMPGVSEGDEPYLEVIECPCDDETEHGDWKHDAKWTVYRVEPEQFKLVEHERQVYLVCLRYEEDWPHPLPQYDEWFHKHLDSIADSEGSTMQDLRDEFCSDDPKERAQAYISLAGYWGWHELDHYPLSLTQHEVFERYGMAAECECSKCERCMICGEPKGEEQLDHAGHCLACCRAADEANGYGDD